MRTAARRGPRHAAAITVTTAAITTFAISAIATAVTSLAWRRSDERYVDTYLAGLRQRHRSRCVLRLVERR